MQTNILLCCTDLQHTQLFVGNCSLGSDAEETHILTRKLVKSDPLQSTITTLAITYVTEPWTFTGFKQTCVSSSMTCLYLHVYIKHCQISETNVNCYLASGSVLLWVPIGSGWVLKPPDTDWIHVLEESCQRTMFCCQKHNSSMTGTEISHQPSPTKQLSDIDTRQSHRKHPNMFPV